MLSQFKTIDWRKLMKRFLVLIAFLSLVWVFATCNAQTTSHYRISWNPDATGKTVNYNVYLEQRATSSGFTLVPGVNRGNTDLTDSTKFLQFYDIPATSHELVVELNNDGQYLVAGVEAMDAIGTWSNLGLNTTPFLKGSAPPIPSGITIEKLD